MQAALEEADASTKSATTAASIQAELPSKSQAEARPTNITENGRHADLDLIRKVLENGVVAGEVPDAHLENGNGAAPSSAPSWNAEPAYMEGAYT